MGYSCGVATTWQVTLVIPSTAMLVRVSLVVAAVVAVVAAAAPAVLCVAPPFVFAVLALLSVVLLSSTRSCRIAMRESQKGPSQKGQSQKGLGAPLGPLGTPWAPRGPRSQFQAGFGGLLGLPGP